MTNVTAAETPDQPDPFAAIAAELHRAADDIATLIDSGLPKPDYFNLSIQPGTRGDGDSTAASVDAMGVALTGKAGGVRKMHDGTYHYSAKDVRRGLLSVSIYQSVPTEWAVRREAAAALAEREAELEKLRAEVAELRAAAPVRCVASLHVPAQASDARCFRCGAAGVVAAYEPADLTGLGFSREADEPSPVSPARVPLHTGGMVGPVDGGELVDETDDERCETCGESLREIALGTLGHIPGEICAPVDVPEHYKTSGWTGGDSGSGVACACCTTFDGFATLAEAGKLLASHIKAGNAGPASEAR
jgi:hypothetical protein